MEPEEGTRDGAATSSSEHDHSEQSCLITWLSAANLKVEENMLSPATPRATAAPIAKQEEVEKVEDMAEGGEEEQPSAAKVEEKMLCLVNGVSE